MPSYRICIGSAHGFTIVAEYELDDDGLPTGKATFEVWQGSTYLDSFDSLDDAITFVRAKIAPPALT